HLRPAGPHDGGEAAGGARPALVHAPAPRRAMEAPRAPGGRYRRAGARRGRSRTGGAGETQIESDRRMIRHRIRKITEDLKRVRVHRRLLRDRRKASGVPVVALVGYPNGGQTPLLTPLPGASAIAADQLFVTLDPTARLVSSSPHTSFVLTDTVGFLRKLPPPPGGGVTA